MAAVIEAPPVPVGADTNYLAKQTEVIKLQHESFSKDWSITINGQPLMYIRGESLSLSHRMDLLDASHKKLYQIRKETFRMGSSSYYAELTEGGPRVWELHFDSHLFSGDECTMKFENSANGGQMDMLHFKNNAFGSTGYVTYREKQVAEIKKVMFKMNHTYEITVSQGLDMSLVCAIILCLSDKTQTRNAAAAAAGGGAGC
jgi:uncharacterized protein YxjI